jgi:hypothetical protein
MIRKTKQILLLFKCGLHCKANTEIAKQVNITRVLHKIQEYKRNWLQHINRTHRYRLPRIRKLQTNRQEKPEETINEGSRRARPAQVNKWLKSNLAI